MIRQIQVHWMVSSCPINLERLCLEGQLRLVGIPHITTSESGGTIQLAEYGSGPRITRVEGRGNDII